MTDDIVSVRMPSSLLKELKEIVEKQHYMDLSDAVRSVVRLKATEQARKEFSGHDASRELIVGLKQIITELKNEAKE